MVDSIGSRPIPKGDLRLVAVTRTSAPASATTTERKPETAAQAPTLAAQLAAAPPVDRGHVEKIKQAVADGDFPISPATIADRLIAARYEWMSNDQA